jgi:hypothetical protein
MVALDGARIGRVFIQREIKAGPVVLRKYEPSVRRSDELPNTVIYRYCWSVWAQSGSTTEEHSEHQGAMIALCVEGSAECWRVDLHPGRIMYRLFFG